MLERMYYTPCPSIYRCSTDQSTEVLSFSFSLFSWEHLFVQQIPEVVHTCLPFVIQVTDDATYIHSGVCILQVIMKLVFRALSMLLLEMHWQTLLCSLVYTAISFLHSLYSYFHVFLCDLNWLHLVLNMSEYRPFANIHRFPGFCGNGHAWQTADTRPLSLLPRGLGMRLKSTLIEISQVLFVFPFITCLCYPYM